jgi:hypothetical protein
MLARALECAVARFGVDSYPNNLLRSLIMSRTTIIAELTVFVTLILGIIFFCAHMWDDTPRGLIVLAVSMSLVLGYHTSQFLNRFESGE